MPIGVEVKNYIGAKKETRLDIGKYFFDIYQKITLFIYFSLLLGLHTQPAKVKLLFDYFKSIILKKYIYC